MKTYIILYAEDVPHYAQGEVEARGPKDAIAKARKLDTESLTAYEPDWSGAVCRRIVSIEDPKGRSSPRRSRSMTSSCTMPTPECVSNSTPPRPCSKPYALRRWPNSIPKPGAGKATSTTPLNCAKTLSPRHGGNNDRISPSNMAHGLPEMRLRRQHRYQRQCLGAALPEWNARSDAVCGSCGHHGDVAGFTRPGGQP
jgi:hypothetical protein